MNKRYTFIIFFIIIISGVKAQDYQWWNEKHNWDQKTHWTQYLTMSPAYLGPNAIPVPEFSDGKIKENLEFSNGFFSHLSKGDKTFNLFSHLSVPIGKRVVVEAYMVPVEYFELDSVIRDIRAVRDYEAKGIAVGDVYFGTRIQIVENNERIPDIALGLSFKTASGSQLRNARYTDTPGYFFDISFGKTFKTEKSLIKSIRPFGVLGFYSWQTYMENNQQNDAALYGAGINIECEKINVSNSIGGYYGYLNNGDRPVVYRFGLSTSGNKTFKYRLIYQYGIHNFPYQTAGFSIIYNVYLQAK